MYKIKLDKEDFLRYQLFTVSQSKRLKNQRKRTWILLTLSFLLLGLALRLSIDKSLSYWFFGLSAFTLIFYPFYQKVQYKKHYEKHIKENYKNKIGIESELSFEDGYLINKSDSQEGKLKLTEIQEINEIADNLFIKIKTGESIVIPSRFGEYNKLKDELIDLISHLGVEWNKHLDWKWK
jgi:hypothetical protein